MKKIYLINKQDRYCPENNNGDYIVAAYLDEAKADKAAAKLDKKHPCDIHYVYEMEITE